MSLVTQDRRLSKWATSSTGRHRELEKAEVKKAVRNFINPVTLADKNMFYSLASGVVPVPVEVEMDVHRAEALV